MPPWKALYNGKHMRDDMNKRIILLHFYIICNNLVILKTT